VFFHRHSSTIKHVLRQNLISLLILFHLIVVPIGSLIAVSNPNRNAIQRFMSDYVYAIRVQQYWSLFSPNPRRSAVRYYAELTHRDGAKTLWRRPYPPNWGFFERHLSYNFQKWDLVSNYLDRQSALWKGLTNYLVKHHSDPGNPITEIRFYKEEAPWPAPESKGYVGGDAESLQWNSQLLFTYETKKGRFL
jgi:hypothetical protein